MKHGVRNYLNFRLAFYSAYRKSIGAAASTADLNASPLMVHTSLALSVLFYTANFCSCACRKHFRQILALFFCSFRFFLRQFCLIIQCTVHSDMQDGGGREKYMREVASQTCIHNSLGMERVSFTLLCHVELDHKVLNFKQVCFIKCLSNLEKQHVNGMRLKTQYAVEG